VSNGLCGRAGEVARKLGAFLLQGEAEGNPNPIRHLRQDPRRGAKRGTYVHQKDRFC
jgi:hypothetical protein